MALGWVEVISGLFWSVTQTQTPTRRRRPASNGDSSSFLVFGHCSALIIPFFGSQAKTLR
jgi:hypothetical protein